MSLANDPSFQENFEKQALNRLKNKLKDKTRVKKEKFKKIYLKYMDFTEQKYKKLVKYVND